MSGEPPRDASPGTAPGPSSASDGERLSQPTRGSEPGAAPRPAPAVPRPSGRKPTFPGVETTPKEQSPIPPPAKVPQVPGLDALIQQDASPPLVPEFEGRAATPPPPGAAPATDGTARRRSRRTVKIPDDAVPAKASPSVIPAESDDRKSAPTSEPLDAEILELSCQTGEGLDGWLQWLLRRA